MVARANSFENRIITAEGVPHSDLRDHRPLRGRFDRPRVAKALHDIYGEEKYEQMKAAGVDQRMMFGTNPHYWALAMGTGYTDTHGHETVPKMPPSKPVAALILPRLGEADDISGHKDPGQQMKFTPQDNAYQGKLLHKYGDIVLGYASPVCSAHCRYCYRLDLFNQDTGKERSMPEELRDYLIGYNEGLKRTGGFDPATGEKRYPARELLLSGGDPMVLTNELIYRYAVAAGQAGMSILRFGTKEVAFRPARFDEAFAQTLRMVRERFPDMHINIVSHFSHPDEFLLRDAEGNYIPNESGAGRRWMPESRAAIRRMLDLGFVSIENQTPIVQRVNDDPRALHILHEELRFFGVKPKYIFQGRKIEGYQAFSLPVEETWRIHNEAMKGLSDTARSRLAMSTRWGKLEIVGVTDPMDAVPEGDAFAGLAKALGQGIVIFKTHRSPYTAETQGDLVIARRNPQAMWISDYADRVLYDMRTPDDKYKSLKAELCS